MEKGFKNSFLKLFGIRQGEEVRGKKISDAAKSKNVVRIRYKKKNGNVGTYLIEPYSYRNYPSGNMLFGYDIEADKIKMFNTARLNSVVVLDKKYNPRYDVEIEKSAAAKQRLVDALMV